MKGFEGFESFDETYVHTKHNEKDRTVLEYRADKKGKEYTVWDIDGSALFARNADAFVAQVPQCLARHLEGLKVKPEET